MKPHIPINLHKKTRAEIVKTLKPGDSYGFILDDYIKTEDPDNEEVIHVLEAGERFSKWYAPNEPGRVFLIQWIKENADGTIYYQTIFEGFETFKRD